MFKLIILAVAIALSGCGAMDAYRSVAADRSAQAADDVLETAQWAACNGASLGAVRREYPNRDDLLAFLDHCDTVSPAN